MNMNFSLKFLALAMLGLFNAAEATTLSLKFPNNQNIYTTTVGSFFDVNIYADTLPDLGGFDLILTYSSNNLAAQSLTSATVFGADTDASFAASISPGSIHFAEAIAYDSPATSGLNLTAPTLLGTIKFKALTITPPNSAHLISFSPLSELYKFDSTSIGGTAQGGNVRVNAAPPAVPLPSTVFFFAPGLLALFAGSKTKALAG